MDINHFKTKLEEEKKSLEERLSKLSHRDPANPENWETEPEGTDDIPTDPIDQADIFKENENKESIVTELESRLNQVKAALKRIENGTFGICEKGCKIEEKRLEANPLATTCIKHS